MTGRTRGDAPDIEHNWLAIEVKYRASLPAWFKDAMDQAVKSARGNQMPCVIMCEAGQRVGDSYIMFRMSDARDHWFTPVDEEYEDV